MSPGYDEYLGSDAWTRLRASVIHRDGHKCTGCGGTDDLHVHHHTYERFGHESPGDLITLCESCHMAVHKLHREHGGSLSVATAETLAMLRSASHMPRKPEAPKRRSRKPRKRQAKPLDLAQLADAQAAADALLTAGMSPARTRKQLIPALKGQLRKQARDS